MPYESTHDRTARHIGSLTQLPQDLVTHKSARKCCPRTKSRFPMTDNAPKMKGRKLRNEPEFASAFCNNGLIYGVLPMTCPCQLVHRINHGMVITVIGKLMKWQLASNSCAAQRKFDLYTTRVWLTLERSYSPDNGRESGGLGWACDLEPRLSAGRVALTRSSERYWHGWFVSWRPTFSC